MELALAKSAWSADDKCQWEGSRRRGCRGWRNGRGRTFFLESGGALKLATADATKTDGCSRENV